MWVSFYTRCPSWHQRWGTRWNLSHGRHTSHHCTTAPPLSLLNLKWRSCVTLSSTFSSFYITAMHRWSKHDLKLLPQVLPATFSTFHILCSITSSERNSEKRKHLRSKNRLAVTHGFATKRQFDFSCDVFFSLLSVHIDSTVSVFFMDINCNPVAIACIFSSLCYFGPTDRSIHTVLFLQCCQDSIDTG